VKLYQMLRLSYESGVMSYEWDNPPNFFEYPTKFSSENLEGQANLEGQRKTTKSCDEVVCL
jgi:hypothetical protein